MTSDATWWSAAAPQTKTVVSEQRATSGSGAFAGVVVFTIILLLSPQNWFPFLKPLRIAFLAAGLAAVSAIWDAWREGRPLGFSREIITCFVLLGWGFITVPLSFWPGGSVATLTALYIKAVIVFWLLANVVTTKKRLSSLATVLMLCTVPLAVTGVKNFMTGEFLATSSVTRISGYDAGLSGNPNDLALMLNLLLPLSIAMLMTAKRTWVRLFALAIAAIDVMGVIVTFSRGGFIALAAIGITYFVKLVRRPGLERGLAFGILAATILSIPLLPSSYLDRLSTVTDINSDTTGSSQDRWRDTVAAAKFVAQHPIVGAGVGMDALALNTVRGEKWTQVHNVYLEYGVDLGLPGLGLFLFLCYGVFKAAVSSRKRLHGVTEHRDLRALIEGLEISIIVFVLSGPFYPVAYNFYFYFMGGLSLAGRSIVNDIVPN